MERTIIKYEVHDYTMEQAGFGNAYTSEAFEDYDDYSVFDTKEEAQQEVAILKRNGERAIVETFSESSRDSELTEEVNWYNDNFND